MFNLFSSIFLEGEIVRNVKKDCFLLLSSLKFMTFPFFLHPFKWKIQHNANHHSNIVCPFTPTYDKSFWIFSLHFDFTIIWLPNKSNKKIKKMKQKRILAYWIMSIYNVVCKNMGRERIKSQTKGYKNFKYAKSGKNKVLLLEWHVSLDLNNKNLNYFCINLNLLINDAHKTRWFIKENGMNQSLIFLSCVQVR